jgi:ATP-dependent protease ClpP protease subunit
VNPKRFVALLGLINLETISKVTERIVKLYDESNTETIHLFICSSGGDLGVAFGFYDVVKGLNIPIQTIAVGYIRSAAMVIFLSGEKRWISPHSTVLIHPMTKTLQDATNQDQEACLKEGKLLERYYGEILEFGKVRCDKDKFSQMKRDVTVLSPDEVLNYGFAHEIWTGPTSV